MFDDRGVAMFFEKHLKAGTVISFIIVLLLLVDNRVYGDSSTFPPNIEIVVKKGKVTSSVNVHKSTDNDDMKQKLAFTVCIKNRDIYRDLKNLNAELYVFGKEITSQAYELLDKASSLSFDLAKGQSHVFNGNEVNLTYDEYRSDRYGVKYNAYLVFVTDQDGNVIAKKGAKKSFLKYINKLKKLKVGCKFDKRLNVVKDK